MVVIRLMKEVDYEALYALWQETPGMGLRALDDSKAGIARFIKRNPRTCFVLVDNGTIVGGLLCGQDGRRAYIYHALVAKAYRGMGYGKDLVQTTIEALKEVGILKVALVVMADNEVGNGFWEALGFIKREDLTYRNYTIVDQP